MHVSLFWLVLLFVEEKNDNRVTSQLGIPGTYCRFYIRHVARRWRRIPRCLESRPLVSDIGYIWNRSSSRKVFHMIEKMQ